MSTESTKDEARFRQILASTPYFGDWEEWAPLAYDRIPVLPRMVMSHVYGRHDESPLPYSCCPLCTYFRTDQALVADLPVPLGNPRSNG